MSDSDIYAGERWSTEIGSELDTTDFGIICVTQTNQMSPWLNFEAGALSKNIKGAKVVPYMFEVSIAELGPGPLTQFHAKLANLNQTRELILSINQATDKPLSTNIINTTFDAMWPILNEKLEGLPQASIQERDKRTLESKVDEILALSRESVPTSSYNAILDQIKIISDSLSPGTYIDADYAINHIIKMTNSRVKAFIKPARLEIDRDRMVLKVVYNEMGRFHYTNLLNYRDELEAIVKRVMGSGYSLIIQEAEFR